jgi:hypothetical protein
MNIIKCPRCRVEVPADKVDAPNRCLDKNCPLKHEVTES